MGGEGHILDMNNRIRQNQDMRRLRQERVSELRKIYLAHYNMKTSKEEIPENINEIKKQKAWILTGCIILLLLPGLIYLVHLISKLSI